MEDFLGLLFALLTGNLISEIRDKNLSVLAATINGVLLGLCITFLSYLLTCIFYDIRQDRIGEFMFFSVVLTFSLGFLCAYHAVIPPLLTEVKSRELSS